MRMLEKTHLYEQHLGIIYERAIAFHSTTGIPTEDFLSEGDLIFMETVKTWNRNASKFSTWLYRNLNQSFYKLAGKETKYHQLFDYGCDCDKLEIESNHKEFDPVANIRFKEMINNLSEEAQYVAHIILTAPNEILDIVGPKPPKLVRGILSHYLQKQGWSYRTVLKTFKEIKAMLANLTTERSTR